MSDKPEPPRPDYTSIGAYVSGGLARAGSAARATLANIPWDQPATMIDLDGRTPIIGTIRECAQHFGLYKPEARAQARIVLTKPVHREGRRTRTWILDPAEIAQLTARLEEEG